MWQSESPACVVRPSEVRSLEIRLVAGDWARESVSTPTPTETDSENDSDGDYAPDTGTGTDLGRENGSTKAEKEAFDSPPTTTKGWMN